MALTLYGLPAILINTHTALAQVDPDIVEAGMGQGMTDGQVMRRIRFRYPCPWVFAGIRTGAVQIVSAASWRPHRRRRLGRAGSRPAWAR